MKKRLTILTEIIAPYRIPVFNVLARRNDLEVHVVFLAETDPTMRQWHVYKNEIQFSFEVLPSRRWKLGRHRLLINRTIQRALSRSSPDVVVCGGYNYVASWQALNWAKRNEKPFFIWMESTAHDRRTGSGMIEFFKHRFVRDCSGAVVPGKASLEYAVSLGIPMSNIFHAPNAVDNDLFAAAARAARDSASSRSSRQLPSRYFLFVGRLVKEKGIYDLAEAYGNLALRTREEVGLVFAGDGPARTDLTVAAEKIRPGNVQFPGFVQREELPCYYGLAEALIFPTHSDTWGLVVNEAMACGLPIVTSSVAGCAANLVTDGWNGRVVQGGDIRQITAAMQELADNPLVRAAMGERSRERIREFSPKACADGFASTVLSTSKI